MCVHNLIIDEKNIEFIKIHREIQRIHKEIFVLLDGKWELKKMRMDEILHKKDTLLQYFGMSNNWWTDQSLPMKKLAVNFISVFAYNWVKLIINRYFSVFQVKIRRIPFSLSRNLNHYDYYFNFILSRCNPSIC